MRHVVRTGKPQPSGGNQTPQVGIFKHHSPMMMSTSSPSSTVHSDPHVGSEPRTGGYGVRGGSTRARNITRDHGNLTQRPPDPLTRTILRAAVTCHAVSHCSLYSKSNGRGTIRFERQQIETLTSRQSWTNVSATATGMEIDARPISASQHLMIPIGKSLWSESSDNATITLSGNLSLGIAGYSSQRATQLERGLR